MAALLAACGGGSGVSSSATTGATNDDGHDHDHDELGSNTFVDDGARFLQSIFADGLRAPSSLAAGGPQRAVFAVSGGDGLPVVDGLADTIDATLTGPDGTGTDAVLRLHSVGLAVPHYTLLFDPETAGSYELSSVVEGQAQQLQFLVADRSQVGLVAVGESMRPVDTPTFDNVGVFDPICTRFEPCPFHELNLAEALGKGRPTALLISTPGFCQTASCGPVLELLIELDPSSSMDVVHAEVYTVPERINEIGLAPELLSPVISTYRMDFEPSFIVSNAAGLVTARLDYAFDRAEMADALATVA